MTRCNTSRNNKIKPLIIEGMYCDLIPLEPNLHSSDLFFSTSLKKSYEWIWSHLPYGPFVNSDDMKSTLFELTSKSNQISFAVKDNFVGNKIVGMISILNISEKDKKAEIGDVWFAPEVHRTPVTTESNFLVLKHLFDTCNYQRAEWKCNSENTTSCNTAQRLGYSLEGVFRKWRFMKGSFRDVHWYGLLKAEWDMLKPNYEIWLNDPGEVSLRALNIDTIESLN